MLATFIPVFASLAAATITITDPSDVVGTVAWTADNALIADYQDATIMYQYLPQQGPSYHSDETFTLTHETISTTANNTNVVVITEGSTGTLSFDTIIKEGYSTDLLQASFFGINAAVWVGNDSTVTIADSNITTHNGAAGVYAFGTDTVATLDNVQIYSSGPVAHGLYAAGNGTIYATNVDAYTGGMRSSAFSGDSPGGYIYVESSVAHTDGVGSAVCYALGLCNITNVIGYASHAPVMFMDGVQTGVWTDCDLTAGLLAGMILFGSNVRQSGGAVTLDHTKLTVLGDTMPSLWFGNTIASATIIASELNNTASGLLLIANTSQVTQDFDYFAGLEQNPSILPAEVTVTVQESHLTGDIVIYNGSSVSFTLTEYSTWTGSAYSGYGSFIFNISIDATSSWNVTADSTVQSLTVANGGNLTSINSNGNTVYYNSTHESNHWLGGSSFPLRGGGKITPC